MDMQQSGIAEESTVSAYGEFRCLTHNSYQRDTPLTLARRTMRSESWEA
jgi:hypothetical protein